MMQDAVTKDARKRALSIAMEAIEKNHGKGSVMRMGDQPHVKIDVIPTGSLSIDAAIHIRSVPRGRILERLGPESSGTTTLCLHIIADAQKRCGNAAFIDAEH